MLFSKGRRSPDVVQVNFRSKGLLAHAERLGLQAGRPLNTSQSIEEWLTPWLSVWRFPDTTAPEDLPRLRDAAEGLRLSGRYFLIELPRSSPLWASSPLRSLMALPGSSPATTACCRRP